MCLTRLNSCILYQLIHFYRCTTYTVIQKPDVIYCGIFSHYKEQCWAQKCKNWHMFASKVSREQQTQFHHMMNRPDFSIVPGRSFAHCNCTQISPEIFTKSKEQQPHAVPYMPKVCVDVCVCVCACVCACACASQRLSRLQACTHLPLGLSLKVCHAAQCRLQLVGVAF